MDKSGYGDRACEPYAEKYSFILKDCFDYDVAIRNLTPFFERFRFSFYKVSFIFRHRVIDERHGFDYVFRYIQEDILPSIKGEQSVSIDTCFPGTRRTGGEIANFADIVFTIRNLHELKLILIPTFGAQENLRKLKHAELFFDIKVENL